MKVKMAVRNSGVVKPGMVKTIWLIFLVMTAVACDPDREPKYTEELPEDLTTQWKDEKDEFLDLSEKQLNELEEYLIQRDDEEKEAVDRLISRIDNTRSSLNDLRNEDFFEWEELRNEIADTVNTIQNDIEDRFGESMEEIYEREY